MRMTQWRRGLLIGWVLFVCTLAACQTQVTKTQFTKDDGEERTTLTFYTRGSDRVTKQVTVLDLDLAQVMGTKDAATLRRGWRIMQADAKAHAKLAGVKATVSRAGQQVHEVITVDTRRVDFAKLAKVDEQDLAGHTDHISLANVTRTLKAQGYTQLKP